MSVIIVPNLRRTSEEKLNDIVNIERVEIWGYRHKQGNLAFLPIILRWYCCCGFNA